MGKVLFSTGFVFYYFAECFQSTCLTSPHFSKDLLNSVAPTLATVSEHTQVEGSGSISYEGSPTREHCTQLCSFQGRTQTTFLPFYTSTVTVIAFLRSDGNSWVHILSLFFNWKLRGTQRSHWLAFRAAALKWRRTCTDVYFNVSPEHVLVCSPQHNLSSKC